MEQYMLMYKYYFIVFNSVGLFPQKTPCLMFNPVDEHSMVNYFEDYLDTASLEVPVLQFLFDVTCPFPV